MDADLWTMLLDKGALDTLLDQDRDGAACDDRWRVLHVHDGAWRRRLHKRDQRKRLDYTEALFRSCCNDGEADLEPLLEAGADAAAVLERVSAKRQRIAPGHYMPPPVVALLMRYATGLNKL